MPKSFWLNLQAHYTAELLEFEAANTVTQAELSILPVLHEITAWLRSAKLIPDAQDDKSTVLSLRKMLCLSNISSLAESAEPVGAFRMSKNTSTNPIVMNAWLQLCKTLCERDTAAIPPFDVQNVDALIHDLKQVMISSSSDIQDDLTKLMSQYGIKFRIMQNFKGAPVHGYVCQNKYGEYQMILTIRGAFADIFWFSLFHEIGHIVNGDVSNQQALSTPQALQIQQKKPLPICSPATRCLTLPATQLSFLADASLPAQSSNMPMPKGLRPLLLSAACKKKK